MNEKRILHDLSKYKVDVSITEAQWEEAAQAVRKNITIADQKPEPTPEVYRRVRPEDV